MNEINKPVSHDVVGRSALELPKPAVYDRVGACARQADPVGEFGKRLEKEAAHDASAESS